MTNNMAAHQHEESEDDYDLSEVMCDTDHDMMSDIMAGLVEASNNNMKLAMDLTRLAVEKNTKKEFSEDEIFSIFKKSVAVVTETSPLQDLLDKLPAE